MSFKILLTNRFVKELKRLVKKFPSLKSEYSLLITQIATNPETGTSLGNNCFKIRIAIASKGKGKRGGARVITYMYVEKEIVYLLTIYDKGEKADLRPKELTEIIRSLDLI